MSTELSYATGDNGSLQEQETQTILNATVQYMSQTPAGPCIMHSHGSAASTLSQEFQHLKQPNTGSCDLESY